MLLRIERTATPRGFRLVGDLDVSSSQNLAAVLEPEARRGGDLTLDVAGLSFIDSMGIGLLIKAARHLEGNGRLILQSPGTNVAKVLALLGLDKLSNLEVLDAEPSEVV